MSALEEQRLDDRRRVDEVRQWLQAIGMGRYFHLFIAYGFDSLEVIREVLTSADALVEAGVTKPAHVRYLLARAAALRHGARDLFDELPAEVAVMIFAHLDVPELLAARRVCRRWAQWAQLDAVWRRVAVREVVHRMAAPSFDAGSAQSGGALACAGSAAPVVFDERTTEADVAAQREAGQSWMSLYLRCMAWRWDDRNLAPQVLLADHGFRAVHSGAGTHHGLRTSQGIVSGQHYFEVLVLGQPNDRFSHSIGVANARFKQAWLEENDGIGWYLNGNVYALGAKTSRKFPTWGRGDRVGVVVDADRRFLYFVKNGVPCKHRILLRDQSSDSLYFCVLMGGSEAVFLRHGGALIARKVLAPLDIAELDPA